MSSPLSGQTQSIAVIPVRAGSKGVRNKNLQEVGGKSLTERAALSCAGVFDRVVVSSDEPKYGEIARKVGVEFRLRPKHLAQDDSSSESVVLDVLEGSEKNFGIVALVQATSPFLAADDLQKGLDLVQAREYDSVFSGYEFHGFEWRESDGSFAPFGHSLARRPRRQELGIRVVESGGFYIAQRSIWDKKQFRLGGRIGCVTVDRALALEIDEPRDLEIAQILSEGLSPGWKDSKYKELARIKAVVLDFDGVLTDNSVLIDDSGRELAGVSRADGLGTSILKSLGIKILIASSERSEIVHARAKKLGIDALIGLGEGKLHGVKKWCTENSLELRDCLFIGNDLNDLELAHAVGHFGVPADGAEEAKRIASIHFSASGGRGVVRELSRILSESRKTSLE